MARYKNRQAFDIPESYHRLTWELVRTIIGEISDVAITKFSWEAKNRNMDYQSRREKLRILLKKTGAQALLVTGRANVTYLTGFTGDSSYLLVTPDGKAPGGQVLISDGRFVIQIAEECPKLETYIRRPDATVQQAAIKVIRSSGISSLAIEADSMNVATRDRMAEKLPKVAIGHTSGMIEHLRQIKDKEEIALIREAVRIAERSFAVIRASLRPEQTEIAIGDALEHQIRLFGGEGPSFPPIVAVGDRAALPHANLTNKRVEQANTILIDWGANYHIYKSDLTRVLVTGKISPKLRRIYELVLAAQTTAIAAIRPGVAVCEVDAAARKVVAEAGFARRFNHGLGHGLGLEIHEAPLMKGTSTATLKPGMVVTVEPGIYLTGWGGVRIEDDVLVTRTGHEVLSSLPKQLEEMIVY